MVGIVKLIFAPYRCLKRSLPLFTHGARLEPGRSLVVLNRDAFVEDNASRHDSSHIHLLFDRG